MLELLSLPSLELTLTALLVIVVSAFLSGVLHGATGVAGGILMAAILSNIIGVKMAIPAMTCALIFSHSSRIYLYREHVNWPVSGRVMLFGVPMIVLGAFIFTYLNARVVAIIMVLFLLSSFPIKAYAKRHQIKTSPRLLAGASAVWGMLAGNVIGPGFFLAPFLLGTGMNRLNFVGTLAVVTLAMNVTKIIVFGASNLMTWDLVLLGIAIGLIMMPGNWVGKQVLSRMTDQHHGRVVDVLTVLIILNFLYLSINP